MEEYRKFSTEVDQFLAPHFDTPLREKFHEPLKVLRYWLKRGVEKSRTRQALIKEATTNKIAVLRSDGHFVDIIRILRLSNKLLKQWIQRKFQPMITAQMSLKSFIS